MANNFDSNFSRKLAKGFLAAFESVRIMSKNVNTQLLSGKFGPDSGGTTDFKRPTDYKTVRTSNGDLSSATATSIISGKASGVVQNYFTEFVDYDEADEAIKMDELDELLRPMATRMCTDIELDFAAFMMKNSGLLAGTYGTAADTWEDVADAGAMMQSTGVPMDKPWYYAVNPFTQTKLSTNQRSLGAGGSAGAMINEAHQKATITSQYAGFDRVMTATTLPSFTTAAGADKVGAISTAGIDVTYVTAKDTMTQSITVEGFNGGSTLAVNAGEVLQITGRNRLNLSTRQPVITAAGANVLFTGVVTEDATLTSGAGVLKISGPAIYESAGTYNTTSSAAAATDVVTLLGAASTLYQPNLFWYKDAFSIGSVPIKKLQSVDTNITSKDGLQFRVSKGSDWTKNSQQVRIDFRPAYACLNPFFAGQGFGS